MAPLYISQSIPYSYINGYSRFTLQIKAPDITMLVLWKRQHFFMRSKIYLKTTIAELGRAPTVRIANMVFRWCRRNLGVNGRKKYAPVWYVRKGWSAGEMGEYDAYDNELFIYYDNIPDVRELIRTIVHEWTHQNQPILTKYHKYPGTYSRNPYERAARYAELKWTPVIWKELKHKINK